MILGLLFIEAQLINIGICIQLVVILTEDCRKLLILLK